MFSLYYIFNSSFRPVISLPIMSYKYSVLQVFNKNCVRTLNCEIAKAHYFQFPIKYIGLSSINERLCSSVSNKEGNPGSSNEEITKDEDEELLYKIRNKSGLRPWHFRRMHRVPPVLSEDEKYILPLWQYRKLFGRYGTAAGIDIKALWPSTEEMNLEKERENLEFPHTVQEMIRIAKAEKEEKELEIMAKQNEIVNNFKKLDKWISEVKERKRKEELEAELSLEKKQKQIEEVRQIFGYHISPHDERFQEALDKKIEEDKIRLKKEKKLRKQQRELERLHKDVKQAQQTSDSMIGKSIIENQELPEPPSTTAVKDRETDDDENKL